MADETLRGGQDGRMRPVARPQHDTPHVRFVAQLEQVLDGAAPEGVDRLVVVPHQGQLPVGRQQPEQLQLDRVDVLGLVHEHVAEPIRERTRHRGRSRSSRVASDTWSPKSSSPRSSISSW